MAAAKVKSAAASAGGAQRHDMTTLGQHGRCCHFARSQLGQHLGQEEEVKEVGKEEGRGNAHKLL